MKNIGRMAVLVYFKKKREIKRNEQAVCTLQIMINIKKYRSSPEIKTKFITCLKIK